MADPRPLPPALPRDTLAESWNRSPKDATRLLLLDYDGTLSPHVNNPEDAIATPHLLRVLTALAADPQNALWVISGRPGDFLERQLGGIAGIGISCEHGGFTRHPGTTEWVGVGMYESDLKDAWVQARDILEKHVKRLDGAFIEYKKSSFTFAYRMAPAGLAPTVIQELQADLQALVSSVPGMVVKQGVYVIEVRPVGVDKGEIAKGLIARYPRVGFSLAAGDEGTDEDMFAAIHASTEAGTLAGEDAWTVFVDGVYGLRSCAKYMVGGIPEVIEVLGELAGVKE